MISPYLSDGPDLFEKLGPGLAWRLPCCRQSVTGAQTGTFCRRHPAFGSVCVARTQSPGCPGMHLGLVWEMEESSGWKRIEGDFGKF
jgi:hypothetical protein